MHRFAFLVRILVVMVTTFVAVVLLQTLGMSKDGLIWGILPLFVLAIIGTVFHQYSVSVKLMAAGRFDEALKFYRRQKKWSYGNSRATMQYNVANALAWAGAYDDALAELEGIREGHLIKGLRPSRDLIKALSLAGTGRASPEALALAEGAAKFGGGSPHALLVYAWIADLLGNRAAADQAVALAEQRRVARPGKTVKWMGFVVLYFPEKLHAVARAFLLGHYWLVRGDKGKAIPLLEEAMRADFANGYSMLAQKALAESTAKG
jgi:tetratricopeptide (TPR) repeat protein